MRKFFISSNEETVGIELWLIWLFCYPAFLLSDLVFHHIRPDKPEITVILRLSENNVYIWNKGSWQYAKSKRKSIRNEIIGNHGKKEIINYGKSMLDPYTVNTINDRQVKIVWGLINFNKIWWLSGSLIYTDFSTAFDRLFHRLSIAKLKTTSDLIVIKTLRSFGNISNLRSPKFTKILFIKRKTIKSQVRALWHLWANFFSEKTNYFLPKR